MIYKMELEEKINEVLSESEIPEEDKMLEALILQQNPEMLEMFE